MALGSYHLSRAVAFNVSFQVKYRRWMVGSCQRSAKHLSEVHALPLEILVDSPTPRRGILHAAMVRIPWSGKPGVTSLELLVHALVRPVTTTIALRCLFNTRFPNFGTIQESGKKIKKEQVPLSYDERRFTLKFIPYHSMR